MRLHRVSRRRGFSLVEAGIAVTLTSIALGMAAMHLHALLATQRSAREHLAIETSLARIERQFREDAHAASGAAIIAQPAQPAPAEQPEPILEPAPGVQSAPEVGAALSSMRFSLTDGRTIEYRVEESELVRIVMHADKVLHRESYRLANSTTIRWLIEDQRRPTRVGLLLSRPSSNLRGVESRPRTTRIEATLGLDQRFSLRESSADQPPSAKKPADTSSQDVTSTIP